MLFKYSITQSSESLTERGNQRHLQNRHYSERETMIPSLTTLPAELVYRVLDHLEPIVILLSARNVCQRLNAITDTYHAYQVHIRNGDSSVPNEERSPVSNSSEVAPSRITELHRTTNKIHLDFLKQAFTSIDLSRHQIGAKGAQVLASAVGQNTVRPSLQ